MVAAEGAKEYDLTQSLAPFMDLHFVFPMLDFLSSHGIYPEEELMTAKLELLKPTNMVDFATEVYQKLNNSSQVPSELETQRKAVLDELNAVKAECSPMLTLIDNEEEIRRLQAEKELTAVYLKEHHQITPEIMESFYKYAKLQFELEHSRKPKTAIMGLAFNYYSQAN